MQNYDEPNNMQCLTQSRLIDMSHLANLVIAWKFFWRNNLNSQYLLKWDEILVLKLLWENYLRR